MAWLWRHPVAPLMAVCAGSSLLCVLLLLVRKLMTGTSRLGFMPFNLFLAFLPVAFLLMMERSQKRSHAVACGILWLLFFPNAPYVITDLVHFDKRLGPVSWMDLLALVAAAWAALLGGMITLRFMQERVRLHRSALTSHAFVSAVLFLTAIGIYIGRFLRFHSWHVVQKPHSLFQETVEHFLNPAEYPMVWPFTFAVFALLVCVYYSLLAFTHAARRGTC